jgi:biotin carboxyl carrier protein
MTHVTVSTRMRVFALLALSASSALPASERILLTPAQRANARIEIGVLGDVGSQSPTGVTVTGRVESGAGGRTVLAAPAAGGIVELAAQPGSALQRGQSILTLGGPDVAALQRTARAARAAATAAEQRVRRDRILLKEGVIAASRLEQSEAEYATASAQLRQSTNALPGADLFSRDGELVVRAPVAGMFAGPSLALGQRVELGDTLAVIGTPDQLRVALAASPDVARSLRAGDAVVVRGRGCEARAVLRAVGVGVEANQVVAIDALITDRDSCLLPGETVTASVAPHSAAQGSFALPPRAFVRRGAEIFIFVERADGFEPVRVDPQAARAGFARSDLLRRGDRVAITGSALLKGAWIGIAEEE